MKYDNLFFETLDIKEMSKRFGKKLSDYGFSNFLKILDYKSSYYGKTLYKLNQWYASSKTCNICKVKKDDLKLSDRKWKCKTCLTTHERDRNASFNILIEGASSNSISFINPI